MFTLYKAPDPLALEGYRIDERGTFYVDLCGR